MMFLCGRLNYGFNCFGVMKLFGFSIFPLDNSVKYFPEKCSFYLSFKFYEQKSQIDCSLIFLLSALTVPTSSLLKLFGSVALHMIMLIFCYFSFYSCCFIDFHFA